MAENKTKEKEEKETKETKKVKEEKKKISMAELEKFIIDQANKGLSSEKIGLEIKKQFGIRAKEKGIKIGRILKKEGKFIDPDIANLEKRIAKLKAHIDKHLHDYTPRRSFLIKSAKLKKIKSLR